MNQAKSTQLQICSLYLILFIIYVVWQSKRANSAFWHGLIPEGSKTLTSSLLFWKDPASVRPGCRQLPAAVAATAHQRTANTTCQRPRKCVDGRTSNHTSCNSEPAGNAFPFWHSELISIGALLKFPGLYKGSLFGTGWKRSLNFPRGAQRWYLRGRCGAFTGDPPLETTRTVVD